MKLWATLAVVVALLAAPVTNAAAETFTLYENFPIAVNGDNHFYLAVHYNDDPVTHTETVTPLVNSGDYSFSLDGVTVERAASPSILLAPSSTGDAVLVVFPKSTDYSLQVTGQFVGTEAAHLGVGEILIDPLTFIPDLKSFQEFTQPPPTINEEFNYTALPHYALVFSVGRDGESALLQGSITTNPAPIPGALLLFGSGLLGLAGWRRKFHH